MSGSAPPPGWYADPTGEHGERWWDGDAWTTSTRPLVQEPLADDDPDVTRPRPAVGAAPDPISSQDTTVMAPIERVPAGYGGPPPGGDRAPTGHGGPPTGGETRTAAETVATPDVRPRRGRFLVGMLVGGVLVAAAAAVFVALDEGWFDRHPTAAVGAPVTDLSADGTQLPLRLDVQRTGEHLVAVDTAGSLGTVVIADDDGQRLGEGEGEAQARLTAGTPYWIFLEGTSGEVDVTVRLLR